MWERDELLVHLYTFYMSTELFSAIQKGRRQA